VFAGLNTSHITNTTYHNITARYNKMGGGVIWVNASGYAHFYLERCIFAPCAGAYRGGVLYLDSSSPYVIITSCRFESISASNTGFDIYSTSFSCFSGYTPIDSCTTSTTSESVYYAGYRSILTSLFL
jgi:hypothetical protein